MDFTKWADAYLEGSLSEEDRLKFESYCAANPEQYNLLETHRMFLEQLRGYGKRKLLKNQLQEISAHLSAPAIDHLSSVDEPPVISLWTRFKVNALVAASVAVLAVLTTLWATGYYSSVKDTSTQYSALRRDMNNIRRNVKAQNMAIRNMNSSTNKNGVYNSSHYSASGFALSPTNYIVTNYHVIRDADSVYVQNISGDSYRAKVIYQDPIYDLAVLQITDPSFKVQTNVPYAFKQGIADVGEDVFTYGFPRDEAVYGRGYLSSKTGYSGDTTSYQVSIDVNPGNSGGPLLDSKGNVIGIISGKQTQAEGAAFAIKSNYLLKSLSNIPADSLGGKFSLNRKNILNGMAQRDQIKKLENYIYMVKVY
ncbi:Trypsin-like peptidase domain-containing protein [bacterium A37T11]|nr:Trypsin-like peptidase domain-containing protein [bacterium A37T11]